MQFIPWHPVNLTLIRWARNCLKVVKDLVITGNWFHMWAIIYKNGLCMIRLLYRGCTTFKPLPCKLHLVIIIRGVKKLLHIILEIQLKALVFVMPHANSKKSVKHRYSIFLQSFTEFFVFPSLGLNLNNPLFLSLVFPLLNYS